MNPEIELGRKRKRQIAKKIMGLIEICNFADAFSLLLTAVMFLLVGRTWEDQVNNPPTGSNNFSR